MRRRTASALALALTLPALLLPGLPAVAAEVRVAPYLPVDPPVVVRDRAGDVVVVRKNLAKTSMTRREARAADLVRARFDVVEHDGEASAQVAVTFRRLLPGARRVEQRAQVYFDEESFLELAPRDDEAAFLSSAGGRVPATKQPGCFRPDARTDGTTVTAWLPVRCLLDDSSEMTVDSTVRGTRSGAKPGTRGSWALVGSDGFYPAVPYVRWR